MMNDVMDSLAEIEAAAVKIMENTNVQKAKIVQDSEQRMKEFDKELQKKTDGKIAAMKADKDKEIQNEIEQMRQDSIREIEKLEEEYQASHSSLAQGIVNILTGV